jgi:hypothetical protein
MPYRTYTKLIPHEEIKTEPFTREQYDNGEVYKYAKELKEKYKSNPKYKNVKITYKAISSDTETIDNPLQGAPYKSTFMLQSNPPEYYIRFGYVLEYIKDNILPKVKVSDTHSDNPPIFDIDTDSWDNHMYSLPNQISLDPRVCIVRNSNFLTAGGTTQVFQELYLFKEADNGTSTNQNAAYPMNVYLNFKFVISCLKEDDRGDVNVFEFVSSICTGLNKALGGVNNLEPIIDESSNTLKIIDTTPIPGYSGIAPVTPYSLQLYGYHKEGTQYTSNFIRNIDLKTAITPEYATMITVGATAGGYVKGTEATAFSKWNVGLTDRFKEDFTPGAKVSIKPTGGEDEAEYNYGTKFVSGEGYTSRYGFTSFTEGKFKLVDDIIEGNISIVTEYYKYLLSKNRNDSGGTIGFIPFKLSFSMDGISGIKIYNKLNVNTEFLPKAYGKNMDLIVTGVSHKLASSDWETSIEATVIPKAGSQSVVAIPETAIQETIKKAKKGKITSKNPDKVCGTASANNVNTVYPKSVKWNGTAPVIITVTNKPSVSINLSNQPVVSYSKTIVSAQEYIKAAETVIDKLAPNASTANKKKVLVAAFAISKAEQGYQSGFKGFNNNISGIESSGFSVYKLSDVVGKVSLTEGGTGKKKFYYAFSTITAGLAPLLSKIMDRNMFATGGSPNEFAWRYFRDWNGYGARTKDKYSTDPNWDDCDIISTFESSYKTALSSVNSYSKYK